MAWAWAWLDLTSLTLTFNTILKSLVSAPFASRSHSHCHQCLSNLSPDIQVNKKRRHKDLKCVNSNSTRRSVEQLCILMTEANASNCEPTTFMFSRNGADCQLSPPRTVVLQFYLYSFSASSVYPSRVSTVFLDQSRCLSGISVRLFSSRHLDLILRAVS